MVVLSVCLFGVGECTFCLIKWFRGVFWYDG